MFSIVVSSLRNRCISFEVYTSLPLCSYHRVVTGIYVHYILCTNLLVYIAPSFAFGLLIHRFTSTQYCIRVHSTGAYVASMSIAQCEVHTTAAHHVLPKPSYVSCPSVYQPLRMYTVLLMLLAQLLSPVSRIYVYTTECAQRFDWVVLPLTLLFASRVCVHYSTCIAFRVYAHRLRSRHCCFRAHNTALSLKTITTKCVNISSCS